MLKNILPSQSPSAIRRSLRAKITLIIILPTALILAVFVTFDYAHHRSAMMKNLSVLASYNGQLIVDSLQHSFQASDFEGMQSILDTVGQNKKFEIVYLMDSTGKVIFSPHNINKGIQLNSADPGCQSCHKLPSSQRPSGVVVTESDSQQYFRSMQPIQNGPTCTQCHDPQQKIIGVLLTDISVAPFEAALRRDLGENLLLGGGTILIAALIVNLGLDRLVIRRINDVAGALESFGSGKRNQNLTTSSRDEIGQLESDFNVMQQRIMQEEASTRRLSEELSRQSDEREELLQQLITAQEDERNRVARDLHDELGQALSGLALHSQVIEHWIKDDPDRALKQLAVTRGLIEKTTEQIHELILTLRPSALDDLGLVTALHAHGERLFKDTNINFTLDSSNMNRRLSPAVETALYRTCQEALNNIVKHSGADQVTIRLACKNGSFEGEITDNGRGFNINKTTTTTRLKGGMGLLGMQERVKQCGGTLEICTAIGEGTRIKISIPISNGDHE